MNKQKEALRLALEALETGKNHGVAIDVLRRALADSALDRMAENARELGLDYEPPCKTGSQCTSKCQQCEQPSQQERKTSYEELERIADDLQELCDKQAIRLGKLEAQQQEPIAWIERDMQCDDYDPDSVTCEKPDIAADGWEWVPLYTSPQPAQQQEPYGWKVYGVNSLFMGEFAEADAKAEAKRIGGTCIAFPLYTSPQPSKPWVGLTDEEVEDLYFDGFSMSELKQFARAIEAKLREKNAQPSKPLTDEQIKEIMWQKLGWTGCAPDDINFARAIEAAHGIKE